MHKRKICALAAPLALLLGCNTNDELWQTTGIVIADDDGEQFNVELALSATVKVKIDTPNCDRASIVLHENGKEIRALKDVENPEDEVTVVLGTDDIETAGRGLPVPLRFEVEGFCGDGATSIGRQKADGNWVPVAARLGEVGDKQILAFVAGERIACDNDTEAFELTNAAGETRIVSSTVACSDVAGARWQRTRSGGFLIGRLGTQQYLLGPDLQVLATSDEDDLYVVNGEAVRLTNSGLEIEISPLDGTTLQPRFSHSVTLVNRSSPVPFAVTANEVKLATFVQGALTLLTVNASGVTETPFAAGITNGEFAPLATPNGGFVVASEKSSGWTVQAFDSASTTPLQTVDVAEATDRDAVAISSPDAGFVGVNVGDTLLVIDADKHTALQAPGVRIRSVERQGLLARSSASGVWLAPNEQLALQLLGVSFWSDGEQTFATDYEVAELLSAEAYAATTAD